MPPIPLLSDFEYGSSKFCNRPCPGYPCTYTLISLPISPLYGTNIFINSLQMCQLLLERSKNLLALAQSSYTVKGNLPNIFNFAPDPFQISSKNMRKMFIYIFKSAMLWWCTWCSPWPLSCPDHRYSAAFGFSDPGKQKKGCVHKIEAEESKKQTGGQRDILEGIQDRCSAVFCPVTWVRPIRSYM